MSEFVDVVPFEHALQNRRQPHHQVADWQAACARASARRGPGGLLRFVPCAARSRPTQAHLGVARRGTILPFVRKGTLTVARRPAPADDAA